MNSTIINEISQKTFCAKILIIRFICFKAIAMSLVLSNVAVLVFLPAQVQAQTVPIVITADQPNVWTLEQAHYLLAQMHRRNLDLKAKGLTDLDANAINGINIDILKTLLEVGVEFSQEDLVNNRQAKSNIGFNNTRRQALIKQNDEYRRKTLQLTEDIAILNSRLRQAQTEEERAAINAEIEQKTALQAKVDKQIELNNDELKTLNPADSKVRDTTSSADFEKDKQGGLLDDSFKAAAKKIIENADNPPKLNASLQLDNFLQLQYEIISKQLTLLRDEVGPGERLLFLELPQSINASYDKANNKWAQSWWKILGYTKAEKECESENGKKFSKNGCVGTNSDLINTSDTIESILTGTGVKKNDSITQTSTYIELSKQIRSAVLNNTSITPQQVRTVELIPRQSSLNVNDIKLRNKAGVFNFVASFLFGLGANVNYQRQREQYSQFVQQELYSSAFGKGSREFGWTFTPMPGTERLLSGVRTTYAIVVVPKEANSIILSSKGCYFRRSDSQPQDFERATFRQSNNSGCSESRNFLIPIPGGGNDSNNDFFIKGLTYKSVKKNNRIVVSIYGKNFSSQIGIMINGVPLKQAVGIAQPFIRDDSETALKVISDLTNEKIKGNFERIDSNQIVATFEIPDFEGTPVITLVAPGIAIDINRSDLDNLYINGTPNTSLENSAFMFGSKPSGATPLKIDSVEVFPIAGTNNVNALIYGEGFNKCQNIIINGASAALGAGVAPKLLTLQYKPNPVDELLKFNLTCNAGNDIIKSQSIKNPFYIPQRIVPANTVYNPTYLRIDNVKFISYEDSTLVVELEGSGFTDNLTPNVGQLVVQSATKAVYQLSNPSSSQIITFTDADAGFHVRKVITRAPYPKQLSTETTTKTENN